jgi:hypothetical protein
MGISPKTLKILWGRSGSRCAICKIAVVENSRTDGSPFVLGENAHIKGEKPGSARYDASMTDDQRNDCNNLVVLCPTDHSKIDKDENIKDYPVDGLQKIKTEHENWVQECIEKSIPSITFAELDVVLKYISTVDVSSVEDLALIHPEEKIKKNNLSSSIDRLIRMGVSQAGLVKNFLNSNLDLNFAERMRDKFVEKYKSLKQEGLDSDSIFYSLKEFASGNSSEIKIQTASLCVIAYFFERCDIFEK